MQAEVGQLTKLTDPVGVPDVVDDTVSVKPTLWPAVDGLGELVRTEVVPSVEESTTWDSEPLEPVKFPSVFT